MPTYYSGKNLFDLFVIGGMNEIKQTPANHIYLK